jgi:hypothetical protein
VSLPELAKKSLPYYSFDKIMSYNATYMFVVGARGLGKTYGAKKFVIRDALRTDGENQFIYLRRFTKELQGRGTFFADIAQEFPDYDLRVSGMNAEYAPITTRGDKKRHWKVMGYFMALSTAQKQKSVAFPKVKTILFDEFIIEKGALHYLPNESKILNDLFSTVDRWKDKTRVIFMANSVSITNPYFLAYKIRPDQEGEIVIRGGGFIACHFVDSAEFGTAVYKTKFGQFIADTEYAEFAVGNKFADNNDNMIGTKGSKASYTFTIETPAGIFSVWIDWAGPYFYIQERRPKEESLFLTTVPELMTNDKVLAHNGHKLFGYLRAAFRGGRAFFDTPVARNAFIELFQR